MTSISVQAVPQFTTFELYRSKWIDFVALSMLTSMVNALKYMSVPESSKPVRLVAKALAPVSDTTFNSLARSEALKVNANCLK